MNILKSLWPAPSATSISIPQHTEGELEDDVDLKIKSLSYFFKRFDMDRFPAFIPSNSTNVPSFEFQTDRTKNANDRLDSAYNRSQFERLILGNEHRILIDWVKNRFRSLLILSGTPESGEGSLVRLGNPSSGFKFSVLKPDEDDETYIKVIVKNSGIYQEHGLDLNVRANVLKDLISQQRDLKPSFKKTFNKDDRAMIILKYVEKLSEIVQIERIFKASLTSKLENELKNGNDITKLKNDTILNNSEGHYEDRDCTESKRKPRSPVKPSSSSPTKHTAVLHPMKIAPSSPSSVAMKSTPSIKTIQDLSHSPASLSSMNSNISISRPPSALRSRSSSPVKSLKKKQSMTLLKLDSSLQRSKLTASTEETALSMEEINALRTQSENAVISRLERERKLLLQSKV